MKDIIRLPVHVEAELVDYALGGGTCQERATIEAHLERCPRCVRELAEVVDSFTLFAEAEMVAATKLPRLKDRLLESLDAPAA